MPRSIHAHLVEDDLPDACLNDELGTLVAREQRDIDPLAERAGQAQQRYRDGVFVPLQSTCTYMLMMRSHAHASFWPVPALNCVALYDRRAASPP